jgi:hypothetical protein
MNRVSFQPVLTLFALLLAALSPPAYTQQWPAADPVVTVDFSNPGTNPAHWVLILHPDGSGHFHSEHGVAPSNESQSMDVPDVDRDVRLSPDFAAHVFQVARGHHWFREDCDSHMKVAFQGWKKISYAGPEGQGSCTFNFSKDKDIAELGDTFVGVSETIREGARLELLLQHDRLGLDQETEFMVDAVKDGRLRQIGVIRDILERLADDPEVMDRVRKRARVLLARTGA